MSAQCYTNRRRIRAEASVLKVQYKKGVTVNNNPIYATLNCLPDFQELTYIPACECPFNGRGPFGPLAPPPIPPPVITSIDGGGSGTGIEDVGLWIDGGDSGTGTGIILWFDGGSA
jgi:hypothetical protein